MQLKYLFMISRLSFFFLAAFLLLMFIIFQLDVYMLIYSMCVYISLVLIIKEFINKNISQMVVFIFIFMYVLSFYYIFPDNSFIISPRGEFNLFKYTKDILIQLFLFMFTVFAFYKSKINTCKRLFLYKSSKLLFYINISIALVLIPLGAKGTTIVSGYNIGTTTIISSFSLYIIIPLITAYIFSNQMIVRIKYIYIICLIYSLYLLLLGNRGNVVSVLFFLLIIDLQFRVSFKYLCMFLSCGILFMTVFEILRLDLSNFSFMSYINSFFELDSEYVINNQTEVIYSSSRITALVHNGVISTFDRFMAFIYFILSVFVPSSILPSIAVLSKYLVSDYNAGGGGFIFSYAYVFGGYLGVLLTAYFIVFLLDMSNTFNSLYKWAYSVLFSVLVFTWFSYTPLVIIKLCFVGLVYIWINLRIYIWLK